MPVNTFSDAYGKSIRKRDYLKSLMYRSWMFCKSIWIIFSADPLLPPSDKKPHGRTYVLTVRFSLTHSRNDK